MVRYFYILGSLFYFICLIGCGSTNLKSTENSPRENLLKVFSPRDVGMDAKILKEIDTVINDEITTGNIPGAVIIVGRNGKIVKRKAYGLRAVEPQKEKMRIDTLFDLASCSKPVGTASMTMKLYEEGKLDVNDLVAKYLPEFSQKDKGDVAIKNLLVHNSGLKAYASKDDIKKTYGDLPQPDALIKYICALPKKYKTGEGYEYSCLNFLTLMKVNEIAAQEPAQKFLKEKVFGPLNMIDTTYEPTEEQKARTAPTTKKENGEFLRGEVHDPLANFYKVGPACSGNAGLFSTADDLSIYARMLLNGGTLNEVKIYKPETVTLLLNPQNPKQKREPRTFGWGISTDSPWSTKLNRIPGQEIVSHSGWTGTYIWMDKYSNSFMILLSNREHPKGGDAGPVRKKCADKVLRSVDLYKDYFKKNP